MGETKQKNCKDENCDLKGFWPERNSDGELLFCFRTRHRGENHAVKLTLKEIEEEIKKADIT